MSPGKRKSSSKPYKNWFAKEVAKRRVMEKNRRGGKHLKCAPGRGSRKESREEFREKGQMGNGNWSEGNSSRAPMEEMNENSENEMASDDAAQYNKARRECYEPRVRTVFRYLVQCRLRGKSRYGNRSNNIEEGALQYTFTYFQIYPFQMGTYVEDRCKGEQSTLVLPSSSTVSCQI
ncbi:hypothetical protein BDQ17DRAFT_1335793 [Cyathus striatus]|nr:hypothetical protein BDQ17DRAFT_1335793 [Cyathus striatus]